MRIRIGSEMTYDLPGPTPMIALLTALFALRVDLWWWYDAPGACSVGEVLALAVLPTAIGVGRWLGVVEAEVEVPVAVHVGHANRDHAHRRVVDHLRRPERPRAVCVLVPRNGAGAGRRDQHVRVAVTIPVQINIQIQVRIRVRVGIRVCVRVSVVAARPDHPGGT